MLRYLRVCAALLAATISRAPFKLLAIRMLEAFPSRRACSNASLAPCLNVGSNIQILQAVDCVGGRMWAQFPIFATALFAILLALPACARVESIDQFGNRKTGWILASNFDWGDDSATRVVNVRGFGLNRLGNTWIIGAHDTQVVEIASNCQAVFLDELKSAKSKNDIAARLNDMCRQHTQ